MGNHSSAALGGAARLGRLRRLRRRRDGRGGLLAAELRELVEDARAGLRGLLARLDDADLVRVELREEREDLRDREVVVVRDREVDLGAVVPRVGRPIVLVTGRPLGARAATGGHGLGLGERAGRRGALLGARLVQAEGDHEHQGSGHAAGDRDVDQRQSVIVQKAQDQ